MTNHQPELHPLLRWLKLKYHRFRYRRLMQRLRHLEASAREEYPYQYPMKSPYRVKLRVGIEEARHHLYHYHALSGGQDP